MHFRSVDHVGIVVSNLDRSIDWWTKFLGDKPLEVKTWLAEETDDYVGRILGYPGCDMSGAFWSLPGGTVLEMLQYHEPPPGHVDMETYNVGNTHLCLETADIHADYERMRDIAEFRSPEPVQSVFGPYKGTWLCYLRDPDDISIELVQFPEGGRPWEETSPFSDPYAS